MSQERTLRAFACCLSIFLSCAVRPKLSLVRVDVIPSGDACPGGGVFLVVGPDTNENLALDESEVAERTLVCTHVTVPRATPALPPAVSVTSAALLPLGDSACPLGGTRVSVGQDDGGAGGIAGDGVLQPEEVDTFHDVCNAVPPPKVGSLEAPAGPVGSGFLRARGGASTAGPGVSGGNVQIVATAPTNGGHIKVFKTGSVEMAPPPSPASAPIGAEFCVLPAGTSTLMVAAAKPGTLVDGCWIRTSPVPFRLMKNDAVAKGLHVPAGAVLDLTTDSLEVSGPIVSQGTLRLLTGAATELVATGYFASASALLDVSGPAGGRTLVMTAAVIVNAGTIGAGGTGNGDGADLTMTARTFFNSGTISATGSGSGAGGAVKVVTGVLVSTGVILSSGGSGESGAGGAIELRGTGDVFLSGAIDSSAGTSPGSCVDCPGQPAGSLKIFHGLGTLRVSSTLRARGADGTGAADGGAGGAVSIGVYDGHLIFGGSIDASGGSGATGGAGGAIVLMLDPGGSQVEGDELVLLGVAEIDARSSDAENGDGGAGADVQIAHAGGSAFGSAPGGAVLNQAELRAGGQIMLRTQTVGAGYAFERVLNSGGIDASGTNDRGGGSIVLRGRRGVENTGALTASSGVDGGNSADNGRTGGSIVVDGMAGNVTTGDAIMALGGRGLGGGDGGRVDILGERVVVSGSVTASGGAANNPASPAGDGGLITVSSMAPPSTVSATLSAPAGTGGVGGAAGVVLIDSVQQ